MLNMINMIIDPLKSRETCFMCLRQQNDLKNINSDLIITENDHIYTVSIRKIMTEMFPSQEIILNQVCDMCSNAILKIYIFIQRRNFMTESLLRIVENLDKQASRAKGDKFFLKLSFNDDDTSNDAVISSKAVEPVDGNPQDNIFQCKDKQQQHSKMNHKSKSEGIICHICGKKSKTPNALKSHMNCHKQKQCPYCSKVLKTHSHFRIHVQNHVAPAKRKRKLTSYKCGDCSFTSLNKGSLEAHVNKVHLCQRPHICAICNKGFFKKSNLVEHVAIHEKVKNDTCEVCGDNFVSKRTLLEHLRLHSNETPYECLICFKKFVTSGRRSDHVKRKHMEKTECCMFCNKMFSLKKELNRHVKKAHGQDNVLEGNDVFNGLPCLL